MTRNVLRSITLAILACALNAQTDVARIVGTVTDSTGAVIPGATISVKNDRTGQNRKITAGETGTYVVNQLQPAVYSMTVEAAGMSPAEYKNITLQVGQERKIDVALQPSTMTTEVNVSGGDLVVIDLSSARVGANVSTREVSDLPL